jgi:signal transduction histidine kinase
MLVAAWTKTSSFGPLIVLSATSLNPVTAEIRRLESMIGLVFPLATLIALTGGYWLSGRALNPVRELAIAAGSMSINSLDKRVPVTNPDDEIGQLATTLNSLISRLETAVTEIRRFTADASHEIRTPLAAIRMEAELALSRIRSDNEYRMALSVVVEEVTRLGRLADQLLDLSRHDAGLRQKCTVRINVSHVLHETVAQLMSIAQSKGIKLTLDCEGIPVVLGDEIRLQQAFCNVLENAVKYTASGGSVSVCCKVQQKQLRIQFQDTGIGISPEHIPRLFERFYRVDESRSQNTGGAGLGLPIARGHVQSCSGDISITSKPGVGTTVIVLLPALDECESKAEFILNGAMTVAVL